MKFINLKTFALSFILILYSAFFLLAIPKVPFHPDETTQIYMGNDINLLLEDHKNLLYDPQDHTSEQHYRLIDAPLTRTIIGLTYLFSNPQNELKDWNWSLSWIENLNNKALPGENVLSLARFSLAVFVIPGLVLSFLCLQKFTNWKVSLLTISMFGLNAVFLLHTRRAMAEGIHFFLVSLACFLLIHKPENALLIGIAVGLSFQAKQNSLPLIFVPITIWVISSIRNRAFLILLRRTLIYFAVVLAIHYLLNPVCWADPFHVMITQFSERYLFSQMQSEFYHSLDSSIALAGLAPSFIAWLGNTFFAQPAFLDVGNYASELSPLIITYNSNLLNHLFSGWWNGVILLFLSLAGFLITLLKIRKSGLTTSEPFVTLILISIFQTAFTLFVLPLAFQRYYLINTFLAYIWAGICIFQMFQFPSKKN